MTIAVPARLTQWSVSKYQTGFLSIVFTVAAEVIPETQSLPTGRTIRYKVVPRALSCAATAGTSGSKTVPKRAHQGMPDSAGLISLARYAKRKASYFSVAK